MGMVAGVDMELMELDGDMEDTHILDLTTEDMDPLILTMVDMEVSDGEDMEALVMEVSGDPFSDLPLSLEEGEQYEKISIAKIDIRFDIVCDIVKYAITSLILWPSFSYLLLNLL